MQNCTTATGLSLVINFESFWSRWDLFKNNVFHPNRKGILFLLTITELSQQDPVQHPGSGPHGVVPDCEGPAAAAVVCISLTNSCIPIALF